MKIARTFLDQVVFIELSDEELEQAYRERYAEYLHTDVADVLEDTAFLDPMPQLSEEDRKVIIERAAAELDAKWDCDDVRCERYWDVRHETVNEVWKDIREKKLWSFARLIADEIMDETVKGVSLDDLWVPEYSVQVRVENETVTMSLRHEDLVLTDDDCTASCYLYNGIPIASAFMRLVRKAWNLAWNIPL